jgi:bacteriorhodopsin
VVVVIMALSSLAFYSMAFRVPVVSCTHVCNVNSAADQLQQKRMFHILTAFIATIAFLSYFAMATGEGIILKKIVIPQSPHKQMSDPKQVIFREVYWARYVDWSITTPLLLLDLTLLAGLSGANILVAIVADIIMVLTGLFATFGKSDGQKWGWYTIACIAYLTIVYQLAYNGLYAVASKDSKTKAFYSAIGGFTLIVWTIYPMYVCSTPHQPPRTDPLLVSGVLPTVLVS